MACRARPRGRASSTTISSASRTVDRRCAITRHAMPRRAQVRLDRCASDVRVERAGGLVEDQDRGMRARARARSRVAGAGRRDRLRAPSCSGAVERRPRARGSRPRAPRRAAPRGSSSSPSAALPQREVLAHACPRRAPRPGPRTRPSARGATRSHAARGLPSKRISPLHGAIEARGEARRASTCRSPRRPPAPRAAPGAA